MFSHTPQSFLDLVYTLLFDEPKDKQTRLYSHLNNKYNLDISDVIECWLNIYWNMLIEHNNFRIYLVCLLCQKTGFCWKWKARFNEFKTCCLTLNTTKYPGLTGWQIRKFRSRGKAQFIRNYKQSWNGWVGHLHHSLWCTSLIEGKVSHNELVQLENSRNMVEKKNSFLGWEKKEEKTVPWTLLTYV